MEIWFADGSTANCSSVEVCSDGFVIDMSKIVRFDEVLFIVEKGKRE